MVAVRIPKSVFVVGNDTDTCQLFYKEQWNITTEIKKADMVVFTGGPDIDPHLYGQKAIPENGSTDGSRRRDEAEVKCYKNLSKDQLKIGICRGGQLLNVLNGGSMYQDVDNHECANRNHRIFLSHEPSGHRWVNSYHHQMMIPNFEDKSMEVLGISDESEVKKYDKGYIKRDADLSDNPDYEIIWYGDTNCFCFQPHPEWDYITSTVFFATLEKLGAI
jgi:hypothetical protein